MTVRRKERRGGGGEEVDDVVWTHLLLPLLHPKLSLAPLESNYIYSPIISHDCALLSVDSKFSILSFS